ncbi:MAG TPA: hypothetical protein VIL86_19960 [Tepidisphaeraceae bacterium]
MPEQHHLIAHLIYLLARYLHIVGGTLLVGGTLFYEMVVPVAIGELKEEQQLAVMARARWVFRSIVWVSVFFLLLSGLLQTYHHWPVYAGVEVVMTPATGPVTIAAPVIRARPGWWWAAHASCGLLALLIAVFLTWSNHPPTRPVQWMRLNLVILLIVIFLATAAREGRQALIERGRQDGRHGEPIFVPAD